MEIIKISITEHYGIEYAKTIISHIKELCSDYNVNCRDKSDCSIEFFDDSEDVSLMLHLVYRLCETEWFAKSLTELYYESEDDEESEDLLAKYRAEKHWAFV